MSKLNIRLDGELLFKYPKAARTFLARLKGLIGTRSIDYEGCLLFYKCGSVHNFFMKYTIGVIYLDRDNYVLDYQLLKPWRVGKLVKGCVNIIECHEAKLNDINLPVGSRIEIVDE